MGDRGPGTVTPGGECPAPAGLSPCPPGTPPQHTSAVRAGGGGDRPRRLPGGGDRGPPTPSQAPERDGRVSRPLALGAWSRHPELCPGGAHGLPAAFRLSVQLGEKHEPVLGLQGWAVVLEFTGPGRTRPPCPDEREIRKVERRTDHFPHPSTNQFSAVLTRGSHGFQKSHHLHAMHLGGSWSRSPSRIPAPHGCKGLGTAILHKGLIWGGGESQDPVQQPSG